jgi:hypothetical protein
MVDMKGAACYFGKFLSYNVLLVFISFLSLAAPPQSHRSISEFMTEQPVILVRAIPETTDQGLGNPVMFGPNRCCILDFMANVLIFDSCFHKLVTDASVNALCEYTPGTIPCNVGPICRGA